MSSRVLEKIERVANVIEKVQGALEKVPRLAEMFGVAYFAGKASQRVGGPFETGALGGIVADGLAHSQLPNNQIGGLSLAAYFAAIGLLNILPNGLPVLPPVLDDPTIVDQSRGAGGVALSPDNIYSGLEPTEKVLTGQECLQRGGTVVRVIPQTQFVVCNIPVLPVAGDLPVKPIRGGIQR